MADLIPLFASHYGFDHSSLLTLEEAGKTKPGNPTSICDLAKAHGLKQVVLVDPRVDGFLEAYKHLSKIGIQLIFGLKLCVCADMNDKTDESLKTESNVIVFVRNSQGYNDLLRIQSRAWTDGFYYQGRADWRTLKTYWTDNLSIALPFFSSFIARNSLSFSNVVPDFPASPTVFIEQDSGIPFAPIIEHAVLQFAANHGYPVQPTKSIYYEDGVRDYDAYATFRAMGNRSEFQRPNVDHMCSNRFSFTEWRRLGGAA